MIHISSQEGRERMTNSDATHLKMKYSLEGYPSAAWSPCRRQGSPPRECRWGRRPPRSRSRTSPPACPLTSWCYKLIKFKIGNEYKQMPWWTNQQTNRRARVTFPIVVVKGNIIHYIMFLQKLIILEKKWSLKRYSLKGQVTFLIHKKVTCPSCPHNNL